MSRRRNQRRTAGSPQKSEGKPRAKSASAPKGGLLFKIAVGLVVLVLCVLLGGYLWVRSYLRGEEFREELARQLGAAAKGEATVGEIEWHGTAMEVGQVDLKSRKAGDWALRDVDAKVDLSGFWDKVWIVPRIEIRQARSEWDLTAKAEPEVIKSSQKKKGKDSAAKSSRGWLPTRTEVHELWVQDYEGEIVTAEGSYSWDGMRLETEPRNQVNTIVSLSGGRLKTPQSWLGRLELEEGILGLSGDGVEVVSSEWTGKDFERLEFSGYFGGKKTALRGLFEGWEMEPLLPNKWQDLMGGRLTGELDWVGDNQAEVLEGKVEIADGILQSLPLLDRLAAYAGTARFKKLSFEEARASFRKEGELLEVKDLVLFDEGLIRLEGEVTSRSKALDGQLEVGVPPGLLAHIPGAEEKVFLPGKGGLLWATVQLSGTWEKPKEDLSERMIRAAGERMFEMIPETGQWALRHSGAALDQGTKLLLENQEIVLQEGTKVVEEVIEQGGDVVEEGVRTGFGILNGILGGEE